MKRIAALAMCGSSLATSVGAQAASSKVELTLETCGTLSEAALREHLELELTTLDLSDVDARLRLRCEQSSVLIALSRASGESYPIEARVELRDTARAARERLVALAASELIAQAERARAAAPPVPRAPPTPQPRADTTRDSAELPVARTRKPRPPIELFVAGSAALSGEPRAALWGGMLGTRWGISRAWSVLFDTRFERGQESVRLAEVRWTLLSGFVGAGVGHRLGPLGLGAGLGVRAGWLALAATTTAPNEGRSLTAPWAGVAMPLRLSLDALGVVSPFVAAEAGYVALPVRGNVDDGSVLVAQRGFWLTGSVGLAVAL